MLLLLLFCGCRRCFAVVVVAATAAAVAVDGGVAVIFFIEQNLEKNLSSRILIMRDQIKMSAIIDLLICQQMQLHPDHKKNLQGAESVACSHPCENV